MTETRRLGDRGDFSPWRLTAEARRALLKATAFKPDLIGAPDMDALETALKRLGKVVDRLEAAVDLREQRVEKERYNLTQALQAARAEQARTADAAEGVSIRLEGAIERLNAVMER